MKYAKTYYPTVIPAAEIVYSQSKQSKAPIQILSHSEQSILEEFLLKYMDLSKLGIYICLFTGLRMGEICGLKWEDIDLEEAVISVKRTVQRLQTLDPNAQQGTVKKSL